MSSLSDAAVCRRLPPAAAPLQSPPTAPGITTGCSAHVSRVLTTRSQVSVRRKTIRSTSGLRRLAVYRLRRLAVSRLRRRLILT